MNFTINIQKMGCIKFLIVKIQDSIGKLLNLSKIYRNNLHCVKINIPKK